MAATLAPGRLEQRSAASSRHIRNCCRPHAQQAYRITHERSARRGGIKRSYSYGITSLPQAAASATSYWCRAARPLAGGACQPLPRDKAFGEDASRVRTGHIRPTTRRFNLALALLLSQPQFETVPEAQIYYAATATRRCNCCCAKTSRAAPLRHRIRPTVPGERPLVRTGPIAGAPPVCSAHRASSSVLLCQPALVSKH